MKKKAKKTRRHYRKRLHSAAKIHSVATILFLGFYFSFAFVFGPKILYEDLLEKYETAKAYVVNSYSQVTVTAYVPGLPGKPVVLTLPSCNNNHKPFVRLDWNATQDTSRYDVYRNGEVIAENITLTYYYDNYVQEGQSYRYRVYAKGVRGETASDEKDVVTLYCTQNQPPPPPPPPPAPSPPSPSPPADEQPEMDQLLINGKPINLDTPTMPSSSKGRLAFSGTASIPNAKVRIEVRSKKKIVINLVANNNGFWKIKKFPKKLEKGTHTIFITVIHPHDNSQLQSYLLTLRIGKKKWVSSGQTNTYYKKANYLFPQNYLAESLYPLKISNDTGSWLGGAGYLGKKIEGEIKLNDSATPKETPSLINYRIVDQKNRVVLEKAEILSPLVSNKSNNESLPLSIQLPYTLKEGQYKLVAWYSGDGSYLSDEMPLQIKELPLLTIGQNTKLTCSNLINYTGWIAAIAFAALVLVSTLTLVEYHLSKDAPLHVSEDELEREGLIS